MGKWRRSRTSDGHRHSSTCAKSSQFMESTVSFAIYMIGFLVFLGGLVWAAVTANVPHTYIAIGAVIILGIGIFSAVGRTRGKDPS